MLRACRRVLRPGGRLGFYTIFIAPGLSAADYRRAARARSPGITSWRRAQTELLATAGFTDIDELDVTDEYLRITQAWLDARLRHYDRLREVYGDANDQAINEGRRSVAAIQAGLLHRALFLARRPRGL